MYNTSIDKNNTLGFSLIEVMISALILSISLLGAASLQSKGLFSVIESGRQETATQMINQLTTFALTTDISDPNNPNNFKYMVYNTISPSNTADISPCYQTAGCPINQFYIATVSEWQKLLENLLPQGKGCTCLVRGTGFSLSPTAQPVTIRIAVNWKNMGNRTSTVSIDTQVPSAIINSLNNLNVCPSLATTPPPFSITNTPAGICSTSASNNV